MRRVVLMGAVLAGLAFGQASSQSLQSALDGLGYSINVSTDVLYGELFFQQQQDDVRIIFQESSQYLIEALGWYSVTEEGEWLIGGTETGFPSEATMPVIAGEFGFAFHPNYTGTGFISGIWYSEQALNSDGANHLWVFPTEINGQVVPHSYILAWEDLAGGGDHDFQDMVVRVDGVEIVGASPLPAGQLVNLSQWRVEDGGNDHWYAILAEPLLWQGASNMAGSLEQDSEYGHLAVITSQEENDFIFNTVTAGVASPSILDEYFLGGMWNGSAWTWVTGEPFSYSNWAPSEPNNSDEHAVAMWGRATTDPNRVPGMWNDEDAAIFTFWSIVEWEVQSAPGAIASLSGTVSDGSDMLEGVIVDLYDADGNSVSVSTTSSTGTYEFAGLSNGTYTVDLQIPLGILPISDPIVTIVLGDTDVQVDFEVGQAGEGSSFSWSYWWWKIAVDDIGQGLTPPWGSKVEIEDALLAAFDHFYDRFDGYGIQITEVTCIGDPARAMTFDDLHSILFPVTYDGSYPAKARRSMLTVVLDLASGHLSQTHVVSEDGATASQALTYFADLYQSGTADAAYNAYVYLRKVWCDRVIPAGVIPLSTPDIMYKDEGEESAISSLPNAFSLSQNYPNPFNPTTVIRFSMARVGFARLDIYNVVGQRVGGFADKYLESGSQSATWDASTVASGVYFYRLTAGDFVETKKMVLLK